MLKDLIEKHAPINSTEKVDALILDMQNCRISHTNEVEIQVLYEIRKSKLQIYFKEQWQKAVSAPIDKAPSVVEQETISHEATPSAPTKRSKADVKALRKEIKARAKDVLEEKSALHDYLLKDRPRVFSSKPKMPKKAKEKKPTDPFEMVARREERMAQNRDKRVQPGYSSTGVKLPTAQAMKELQEKRQHYREVYYTNKRHKDADDPKRGNGYIYIDTPM